MFLDVFLICKWFVYRTFLYGFFSFQRDNLIFISLMLAKNQSVSITLFMFICFHNSNLRSDLFCFYNYTSLSPQFSWSVLPVSPSRGPHCVLPSLSTRWLSWLQLPLEDCWLEAAWRWWRPGSPPPPPPGTSNLSHTALLAAGGMLALANLLMFFFLFDIDSYLTLPLPHIWR